MPIKCLELKLLLGSRCSKAPPLNKPLLGLFTACLLLLAASPVGAAVPAPGVAGPYDVGTSGAFDIIDVPRGNRTLPIHV